MTQFGDVERRNGHKKGFPEGVLTFFGKFNQPFTIKAFFLMLVSFIIKRNEIRICGFFSIFINVIPLLCVEVEKIPYE